MLFLCSHSVGLQGWRPSSNVCKAPNSKVRNVGFHVVSKKYVTWLQVSMYIFFGAKFMQIDQSSCGSFHDLQSIGPRKWCKCEKSSLPWRYKIGTRQTNEQKLSVRLGQKDQ
ncbi:hypothetical protein V8G54_031329 [Vigna mungo]|uniref:Uncharacterized protein n=1 Tax=Vigna mungo TaxID=3915 RepID=A0AAQ3RNR8_VIGMU